MNQDYDVKKFFEAAKEVEEKAKKEYRVIPSPSLRTLTSIQPGTRETIYGSLAVDSEPNSRAARQSKNSIDDRFGKEEDFLLTQMKQELSSQELVLMDRRIGTNGPVTRLIVPLKFVQIAYMGGKLFRECKTNEPDNYILFFNDESFDANSQRKLSDKDITIRLALRDDGRAVKIVRNSNYLGEYKKGNFAIEEWRVKMRTFGIFLHAGCRLDYLEQTDGNYEDIASLLIALSANGKTSTTCKVLARKEGEISWLVQDDGGILMPDSSFDGFEAGGIFVKTEGVSPENQIETYYGLLKKETVMENVYIDEQGKPDFFNYTKTSNGRAVIRREDFMHANQDIGVGKVNNLILITRGHIIPAISKLTREQTVALMILGQAMESSAGDPTRAGQIKNEFFYDPFFVGNKTEQVHRLYGILEQNPHMQFYLLNTGGVGEGEKSYKIRLEDTMAVLDSLIRGGLEKWTDSPSGFKVPVAVRLLSDHFFHPEKLYSRAEYNEKMISWKNHARGVIESLPEVDKKIRRVFE